MKIKILKSKNETTWYKHFVDSEFEVGEYDRNNTRLPFKVSDMGWVYESDCVITELPESFCVKRCDDGIKWGKYIKWLNKKCGNILNGFSYEYYGVHKTTVCGSDEPIGTEIHIDDMIKHIDYMERHIKGGEQFHKESQLTVKMVTQRLSREGLKEIYSVACDEWQGKLKSFGYRNPLENYIDLTKEEVNEMFFASNDKQKSILSKYLKQDDGSIDLLNIKFNDYSIQLEGESIIQVRNRGEYKDKSFWLSESYNWEIKKDSKGKLCLIPTKNK